VPLEVVGCKNLLARRLITPAETMKQAWEADAIRATAQKPESTFADRCPPNKRDQTQNRIPLLLIALGC